MTHGFPEYIPGHTVFFLYVEEKEGVKRISLAHGKFLPAEPAAANESEVQA